MLRQDEEHFRSLADAAPVLVWQSGPDGQCNYFNQRWLECTGRTLREELGHGWLQGVHPEDVQRCLESTCQPADDPRVEGTIRAIEKNLLRDGFVLRNQTEHTQDGLARSEGAFLACSFWLVAGFLPSGAHSFGQRVGGRLRATHR